jgi:hypothetical protein
MKRSEMITLISKVILNKTSYFHLTPEEADLILTEIEKLGMMPPIIKSKSFKMLPSGELTYAVHEWEPE